MTKPNADQMRRLDKKARSAQDNLNSTRLMVTALADDPSSLTSDTLANFANRVAEAEGRHEVFDLAITMVLSGYDVTIEQVLNAALDSLANGADDQWSGRRNDAKRSRFDGMRDATRELRWLLS